jgi:predicted transcriptional regulator
MLSNYISQEETPMKLKELRQNKNLSVPQLVEISGVPRRTIQDIEKNNNCKVDTAIKLADALGVTLDELCRD